MENLYAAFESRKQDHIRLALQASNQSTEMNRLDAITLPHEAMPDLDFEDISIITHRFNKPVATPFFVSSMTAGHADALRINHNLLEACAARQWAMGVGSQRRELDDPEAVKEWKQLRKTFPQVSMWGNLGISQLVQTPCDFVLRLVDNVQADAFIVHCNPLQEVLQPEGTPQFKNCWRALSALIERSHVPVIIKETGCGFSDKTLQRLHDIGVAAVDVSGMGGTHWGRIEGMRSPSDSLHAKVSETFRMWGIDTVTSVQSALSINPSFEVWGSGGVRHGLDAAKLLSLGVHSVGFAKPMLVSALQDSDAVQATMACIEYELRVAMLCTGSMTLSDLKRL